MGAFPTKAHEKAELVFDGHAGTLSGAIGGMQFFARAQAPGTSKDPHHRPTPHKSGPEGIRAGTSSCHYVAHDPHYQECVQLVHAPDPKMVRTSAHRPPMGGGTGHYYIIGGTKQLRSATVNTHKPPAGGGGGTGLIVLMDVDHLRLNKAVATFNGVVLLTVRNV